MTPVSSSAEGSQAVRIEHDKGIAIVTMAAPPANALNEALLEGLTDVLHEIEACGSRVVILRSAIDGYFAVGADIKHVRSLDPSALDAYLVRVTRVVEGYASLRRPVLAAISGYAVGGGLELALACTFRIADESSRLGLPEVKLGLLPGAGGTQRLPRLVGRSRAIELMLSGSFFNAEVGAAMGVVDRVAAGGTADEVTLAWARELALLPVQAVTHIIGCVDASERNEEDGFAVESRAIRALFETDDSREGIAAFLERRPPSFS